MYIVGGITSRTLSYFASRSTPTIPSCPAVSTLEPKRWPIGFFIREVLARGRFVDDGDLRRLLIVAIGEAATQAHRHFHGLEKAGGDHQAVDGFAPALCVGAALHKDAG